jgi:hypothetical protein
VVVTRGVRRTSAVAIHRLSVPADVVADGRLAGLFEGFGLYDDMLVHRDEILALDDEFGHWIFSCLGLPTPKAPQLLLKGRDGYVPMCSVSPFLCSRISRPASEIEIARICDIKAKS